MHRVRMTVLFLLLLSGCSSGGGGGAPPPPSPPADPGPPAAAPPPVSAPPANNPPFTASALFVLGDSLSDVGNAAAATDYLLNLTIDPPTVGLCNHADVLVLRRRCDDLFYKQSRVSDGAVAVEHLAAHFGLEELEASLHVLPS